MSLADRTCEPCHGGTRRFEGEAAAALLRQLPVAWTISAQGHLERAYHFADFAQALAFANVAGALADEAGHHPDLHVGWGKLGVELWTHSISGLSEADFVVAARIERAATSV